MARYTEGLCKVCRREGVKLFLKGERCYSAKCSVERGNPAPGQHGAKQGKLSDYAVRLREKQKLRSFYGLMEAQFRRFFKEATRKKGDTGEELIKMLESRLDNVVTRMGFCANHNMSRQLITHGHITVNDKKVNIPSYLLKAGDVVSIRAKSREIPQVKEAMEQAKKRGIPRWCDIDWDNYKGVFKYVPSREEIPLPVQEQLIVEFYFR